ncbi:glycolate permease GlcA [Clostridium botulinum E1 str. 'BoNT E Beluga']|nr:glycolate permease GlcA [Clostridium botulinum E1 str. 'BoNT E Beluga']
MYILFVLACIPIVWLMISLGKLKIAGHKACPIALLITGSDTSANVLFGELQVQAANSIGATAGKMISPQSIAVATAATNLVGSEGKILNSTLKVCLFYIVFSGLLIYFCGPLFGF